MQHVGKIYVNDRNTDCRARVHDRQPARRSRRSGAASSDVRGFVRVNNVTDRDYVGSVIVGDTNGRFFEPAPGRNVFAGATRSTASLTGAFGTRCRDCGSPHRRDAVS